MVDRLKIGSLFSGYGGLDLAVMNVFDAEVAWHCEWEDAPCKILEANFPGVPNYRDVSQVDWASVEPVDILTGGFPCQDVSLAGRRAGLGG
jgi:DNA (cytosine-5)-methyltransferase 1